MTNTMKLTARAVCERCNWTVQMSGDTPEEVANFLRGRLIRHATSSHPEHYPPGAAEQAEKDYPDAV
jgi:hypothetical protein